MRGVTFCFSHNPAAAEQKQLAVRKGGLNRRAGLNRYVPQFVVQPLAPIAIRSVVDVQDLLFQTLANYRNGVIDGDAAKTIGYLSGVAVKVAEVAGLAERLEELREEVMTVHGRLEKYDAIAARH